MVMIQELCNNLRILIDSTNQKWREQTKETREKIRCSGHDIV